MEALFSQSRSWIGYSMPNFRFVGVRSVGRIEAVCDGNTFKETLVTYWRFAPCDDWERAAFDIKRQLFRIYK